MRVVVTRPAEEGLPWVAQLREAGFDALALPLIEIGPAPSEVDLQSAWERLAGFMAVMFVSGNAVRGFFAAQPAGARFASRAWAPGPGTRDALLAAGVEALAIDAPADDAPQFDSETLWTRVAVQATPGARVLIVRGADGAGPDQGRDWLQQQLVAQGARVETLASYTRRPPTWSERGAALARQSASDTWLFSSSQAVRHLLALLPGQAWGSASAVATHPKIAAAAREAGFGVVLEARPALASVIATLESMQLPSARSMTPETTAPPPNTPVTLPVAAPVAAASPRTASVTRATLIALVVLAGGALLASLMLWQRLGAIQEQLAMQSANSGAASIEARALAKQAQDLSRDTSARQAVLETRVSEVALQRSQLEDLMQSLSRSRDENLVVDMDSALRLAQQQMQLTGTAEPLLAALRTAELRLTRAGQPRLARVRVAVNRDIERIQGANLTDVPGVLARMDELVRQVDELPTLNAVPRLSPEPSRPSPAAVGEREWWRRVLGSAWDEARGLLRVSRIDQPDAALLSPDQAFFLRENLKLKLLNARLSLLARQTEAARADVTAASMHLSKYFDPASRRVQSMSAQIQQVQSQLRGIELPRIDETLAALATASAGR